jgi:pilus assembly protein CpaF
MAVERTARERIESVVREVVRTSNLDPMQDGPAVRRLVEEAVSDYEERSLSGGLPILVDRDAVIASIWAAVAGFGVLQRFLDDPSVEEIWVNEPGKVFVARDGVAELTTTMLTAEGVADLVERMLATSGRRVDLSSRSWMRVCARV